MHPDFKPIPPSPGGWVTPDRVVEWERTTEIFEEFSPYLIYNKHNKASEKDSKSEWRKAATWIGASNINGIDNPSSVSGLTPAVEVQRSYKQQSQSMIPKKQSEQALSLLAQRYLYQQAEQSTKRHYHARSWSPQSTCNTSNQFQNVQYLQEAETQSNWYYDLLQQQHQQQSINKSNRSTLSAAEEFNNDHVVNSILRVVDDELQLQPPPPTTMKAKEYCWNQLLQSNTENAFWNNLAIFIKTTQICSTNQLCTPFFFANFARTLMMHHASIHLVGIEMESWDFQGQQRKYYTVKPIYLPAMINQDPMTAVAHLIGFPSTLEENMMRLRESGISSETRMVLKSHFLL
jgi:hypothetical protein